MRKIMIEVGSKAYPCYRSLPIGMVPILFSAAGAVFIS